MKILLIDNTSLTPVNGSLCCEPKTGGFASDLQSLGNDVTMYGQIVEDKSNIHSFDIERNGISVVGYLRKKNKLINYISLYLMVIPHIFKSDFIYIFYPSALKYVAILCWLFKKPYGIYVRGENDLKSRSSKFIFKKSEVIFTVTDHFSNYIGKYSLPNKVFSIKPMIDLNQNDIYIERKYLNNNFFTILFLARIEKDKGIEEFLHAISILRNKYNFKVNIVGNGGFFENAKVISKNIGIDDIVNFQGAIFSKDIIRKNYTQADLYILPTYHEGFPRTLYEAMIYGTPIITTFVGGIPGIMKNKFNSLKIEPKSINSIVTAVGYAFENYSKMESYAQNGMKTVYSIVHSSRKSHAQHLNSILNDIFTKS